MTDTNETLKKTTNAQVAEKNTATNAPDKPLKESPQEGAAPAKHAKLNNPPPITEGRNLSDLVKFEADYDYSRETITVAAGEALALGALLGRRKTSGEVVRFNPNANDGTQTLIGILLENVHTHDFPQTSVMIARHAVLDESAIDWGNLNSVQQTLARVQLEARGLVLRQGV